MTRRCCDVATGVTCSWVAEDLCSFCVTEAELVQYTLAQEAQLAHQLAERLPRYGSGLRRRAAKLYAAATAARASSGEQKA